MPPLDSSTQPGCQSTRLHCFGSCTGCASRSESSSGCVFCLLAYQCAHGTARAYLADIRGCCLSPSALCQLSDDAGAINSVTARFLWHIARAWNSQPPQTRDASSLLTCRRETKSHLFRQSYLADRYLALSLLIDS